MISNNLDSFINWTCFKMSHVFSSVTFYSKTVLGFGQRFQNSFIRPLQIWYLHGTQIRRVIRWSLFIFRNL